MISTVNDTVFTTNGMCEGLKGHIVQLTSLSSRAQRQHDRGCVDVSKMPHFLLRLQMVYEIGWELFLIGENWFSMSYSVVDLF